MPEVTIRQDWCKGCGICVAFCPKKVLELDFKGKARIRDASACTGCGLCVLRCPDFAVEVGEGK